MAEKRSTQPMSTSLPNQTPQHIIVVSTKSAGLAILLAVLFGPIGLLYSTVTGAIVMFIVNILMAVATMGFGLIVTWPICGVWAAVAVNSYNKRLLKGLA